MPAPPSPADPPEIDLDPDDLVPEPEERSTSQTRRLGTNVKAHAELEIKGRARPVSRPGDPPRGRTRIGRGAAPDGKPAGTPYLPGDVIAQKYRLTRIIGRGGMGAVWQAHNIPLDIDVAIKLIRRDRTAAGAADRLLTEARAAARLMHPAIVRVFDFGETDQGDPFIVMELLRGESLNAILRRKKRLSAPVAVQTLLPVAAALASAHAKSIIHRDLKPDNIIVVTDENGQLVPKIVDFGIAKLLSAAPSRQVTMAGEVLGSPDYMSPEQAKGADNVGEATDIWAFSVVLYELVTGKRPFDGQNYNALIASILTDEPPPIMAHGVGDAALSGIIEHGLVKDVTTRWPRIRDMGAALASWAVAHGVEDDLMGNPIAKQWLSGAARRLLTVQPETGEPVLRSGPVAPPASPWAVMAAPGRHARREPRPGATWGPIPGARSARAPRASGARVGARRASAQRAVVLVVAIVLLGVAGVAAFLLRDRLLQLRAARGGDGVRVGGRRDLGGRLPRAGRGAGGAPTATARRRRRRRGRARARRRKPTAAPDRQHPPRPAPVPEEEQGADGAEEHPLLSRVLPALCAVTLGDTASTPAPSRWGGHAACLVRAAPPERQLPNVETVDGPDLLVPQGPAATPPRRRRPRGARQPGAPRRLRARSSSISTAPAGGGASSTNGLGGSRPTPAAPGAAPAPTRGAARSPPPARRPAPAAARSSR